MPGTFFKIPLSLELETGSARLVPPKALQGLNFQFVVVKGGGKEAIVSVEESQKKLKKLEKSKDCQKLTAKQVETLKKEYPPPKLKQRYRMRTQGLEESEDVNAEEQVETDEKGKPIIDTYQTVRCGFYLIDIPVVQ